MSPHRLLIVEDDPALAASVEAALQVQYDIVKADTGSMALQTLQGFQPDLIFLDLGLPDVHGLQVLSQIRASDPTVRICIMTALDDLVAKEAAFTDGCDDYLVKPFNLDELTWRAEALLKRSRQPVTQTLVFGDTCIFRGAPLVQRAGKRIALSPMEHRLLLYVAERPGIVVTRSELLDEVWQGADRYPNIVDAHIESLRKKVDAPFGRKSIRTAYRQGYFFEP